MAKKQHIAHDVLNEIPLLVECGILDAGSAERMRLHYAGQIDSAADVRGRLSWVLGVLSAFLIGGGAIMIVAHNWDDFSPSLRLAAAFLPLAAALAGGGYVLHSSRGPVWRDAAAVLISAFFAVAVAVVSQVYHSIGTLSDFLTWVLPPVVALVYVFGGLALATLYVVALAVYFAGASAGFFWPNLLLAAALVPYLLGYIRQKAGRFPAQWARLLLVVTAVMMMIRISIRIDSYSVAFFLWSVFLINLYLGGLVARRSSAFNLLMSVGGLGMLIFVAVFSFNGWAHELSGDWVYGDLGSKAVGVVALGVYGWNILFALMKRRPIHYWVALVLPGLALISVAVGMLSQRADWLIALLFNVYFTFGGLTMMVYGFRKGQLTPINMGMAVLALQMLLRFSEYWESFLTRGLVFIAIGVLFAAVNFWFVRHFRRKSKPEATS
jgi:uncharacterized membrane protein